MKAIVQEGYGSPDCLRLREIDRPVAGDDEVLVQVVAASVNASDWHLLGRLPHLVAALMRVPRSRVRGFDLAGRVESVGAGVTRFRPGDAVFGAAPGSFAEYAATPEDRLAPAPRNLPLDQTAAIPVAGITALQGLRDIARVSAGQSVLVHGAGGGVGSFAVQIAKALGARVTAVSHTRNLEMLRAIGADDVIDYTREDFTRGAGRYDVLFDVGANRSFADCRRVVAPGGILVIAGAPKRIGKILSRMVAARLQSRRGGCRIESFLARVKHADLVVLRDLAEAGRLSPVIDRRYPLSGVPDALRRLGAGGVRGKILIDAV